MGECGKSLGSEDSVTGTMSITDSASVNGLLSTPLVLPAPLAGALAACFW